MVTLAVRDPVTGGVNVTLMEQEAPGARVAPQVFVSPKPPSSRPLSEILKMFRVTVPVFVTVEVRGGLVWPTATVPKFSFAGAGLTIVPEPVRKMGWATPKALFVISRLAVLSPPMWE